jgi:hypothetical protein
MFENQNSKQTTIPLNPQIYYPDPSSVSDADRKWVHNQVNNVAGS